MSEARKGVPSAGFLGQLIRVEQGEWSRFLLAFAYFFFLLGGYFMLRPLRGTVASNDAQILHLLYSATFIAMLFVVPTFGWLVSRFRRNQFIPGIYIFFMLNICFFIVYFDGDNASVWIQRGFYVWLSVYNLFVVSVFWSFMADIFRPGQAQRMFGSIMAGGSLGAIAGPFMTANMVADMGSRGVMSLSLLCLLVATVLAVALGRQTSGDDSFSRDKIIGGKIFEGATHVFQSRYLLLICLLMFSHNLISGVLYNGLAWLISETGESFDRRTMFFSYVDLAVQVFTFLVQFLIASRLISRLGIGKTALIPPALLAGGFVLLGSAMSLMVFASIQILQRTLNYGVLGPVKENLFTVVSRETKYKSKNFIDTVVYRGSDVIASWLFKGFMSIGLPLSSVVWFYLPVMAIWGIGAWKLGAAYDDRKNQLGESEKEG